MTIRNWLTIAIVAALLLGAWLRITNLSTTPLQSDESVNWYLARKGLEAKAIPYDPARFHGPFYLLLLRITGLESEAALRSVSVISSLLLAVTPLILFGVVPLSRIAVTVTLLALDPLLIFYARVAIHETVFVLLSNIFLLTLYRWQGSLKLYYIPILGCVAGILAATKETFPIPLAAGLLGLIGLRQQFNLTRIFKSFVGIAVFAWIACSLAFYRVDAPVLVVKGLFAWTQHGFRDTSQLQPWWYLIGIILLSSPTGLVATLLSYKHSENIFFIGAGIFALVAYSIIPYKTAWLALGPIAALYLCLLLSSIRLQNILILLPIQLLLLTLPFTRPYLEANDTNLEVPKLADRILKHCERAGPSCRVFVSAAWYWPLPFYLREIEKQVAYSERTPALPIESFNVLILPNDATREIPNWNRETVTISRVQKVAVYFRE